MHVKSLGVADVVGTPHTINELTAGHDSAGVAHEHLEQIEFLKRHRHCLTAHGDYVTVDIHAYRARLDNEGHEFVDLAMTTKNCTNARQQLT